MFYVQGTDIKITRGDNAQLSVDLLNADGSAYVMQTGDKLYLTVNVGARQGEPLLQLLADSQATFRFVPESTKPLEFGKYKYDIQLSTATGEVYTVIPVSKFEVLEEITWNG